MKTVWLGLTLFAGLLIPAQAAMNAKMRTFVLNPTYSAMINFFIGALGLVAVMILTIKQGQAGNWRGVAQAPWWAWCGGMIGALIVLVGILAVPRIGAANFSVMLIASQLIGAIVIDQFGLLGLKQHSISISRIAGAGLLLLGVWLVQRN